MKTEMEIKDMIGELRDEIRSTELAIESSRSQFEYDLKVMKLKILGGQRDILIEVLK